MNIVVKGENELVSKVKERVFNLREVSMFTDCGGKELVGRYTLKMTE